MATNPENLPEHPGERQETPPSTVDPSISPESRPPNLSLPQQFGRYHIEKILGQGGMGSVYLARDTLLECPVALKVLRFDPHASPQFRERFLREATAAARLRHDNICPV